MIKEIEPKKSYNAGLVQFVLEHIDEIPYWEDLDCRDHFFDMMASIQFAGAECQDCGEELIDVFYDTWHYISTAGKIPIEEACEWLIVKIEQIMRTQDGGDPFTVRKVYFSYEPKGNQAFLKGTKRLEEEFKVRVSLRDRFLQMKC